MATSEEKAVAAFAKGLLQYVEDENVLEIRQCGFVEELRAAIAAGELEHQSEYAIEANVD